MIKSLQRKSHWCEWLWMKLGLFPLGILFQFHYLHYRHKELEEITLRHSDLLIWWENDFLSKSLLLIRLFRPEFTTWWSQTRFHLHVSSCRRMPDAKLQHIAICTIIILICCASCSMFYSSASRHILCSVYCVSQTNLIWY